MTGIVSKLYGRLGGTYFWLALLYSLYILKYGVHHLWLVEGIVDRFCVVLVCLCICLSLQVGCQTIVSVLLTPFCGVLISCSDSFLICNYVYFLTVQYSLYSFSVAFFNDEFSVYCLPFNSLSQFGTLCV